MARHIKTVEFAAPQLDTLADNTLTAMTVFKCDFPEYGVGSGITIHKAIVEIAIDEGQTQTTGNYTSRRIDVSVGGAAATSYTNSNLYTGSGENTTVFYAADCTTQFSTNVDSTQEDVAISVLIDGTAATIAWRNVSATLYVTYEYDDSATTQIKTVYIPLNAPVGVTSTFKPGTAQDTIPALDTYLPESTKVYKNMHIVCQGNIGSGTNDTNVDMQIDTLTAYVGQMIERGAGSDRWQRSVWTIQYLDSAGSSQGIGMTTNATHDFFFWGATQYHHSQIYMVVTYTFDASASNNTLVSVMLPMELGSPMGGTTSSDYQRGTRELWIEEPGTITTRRAAFYMFYEKAAAISGINCRIGTGSFVLYTDSSGTMCGGDGLMVRNDSAFTLARGRNSLNFDVYRTDTVDLGFNISGFWIINYEAGKPSQGYGAANHTVKWNLGATYDGAASIFRSLTATAPTIPVTDYFLSAVGTSNRYISNSTGTPSGVIVQLEKTSGEGGIEWLSAYTDTSHTDPESGLRQCWSQIRQSFKRWTGDPDTDRLDIETSRRWRLVKGASCSTFNYLDLIFTYHSITYTVSGNISDSNGGTVEINLHRANSGERVLSTSRVGNGSYSLTWFDDTEQVFVEAYEDGSYKGRSAEGLAT